MKQLGIQSRIRKKRKYIGRLGAFVVQGNVLNREFRASRPNEKWATDVTYLTYLTVQDQSHDLSVILDLYNNEVISFKLSQRNDLPLILQTVQRAIKRRKPKGVILHSDQGYPYSSRQYHKLLNDSRITASMSRKGNCLDNACVGSFFGHFKSECFYKEKFKTISDLERAVRRYIHFYNHKRFQGRLKNHSPVEYRTINS